MKAGRPTKYDPKYCDQIITFMEQGFSKEAFCAEVDIHKDTLYEWIKRYPEFSDSVKKAEAKCRRFWEDLGVQLVLAGQGNATAWIFNMKNRFRDDWSDISRTELTGKDGESLVIIKDGDTSK